MTSLGVNESQAGLLGTLEFLGVALSSTLIAPMVGRINRRKVALAASAAVVVVNSLCAAYGSYAMLLLLRPLAGLAAGCCLATGNATIALADKPERFASHMALLFVLLMVGVTLGFSALEADYGQRGVYAGFAVTIALLAPLQIWLPNPRPARAEASVPAHRGHNPVYSLGGLAIIFAVFCFSMRDTMTWAFIERIGVSAGLPLPTIGQLLTAGAVVGLAGPALASAIGSRFGLRRPLVIGILTASLDTFAISQSGHSIPLFVVSVLVVVAAYFFALSYLNALAAELDIEGRIVAAAGSAVMAGLAAAPVVAGYLWVVGGALAIGAIILALLALTLLAAIRALRTLP
jgi:predicted MFS family arabinose efflux permease